MKKLMGLFIFVMCSIMLSTSVLAFVPVSNGLEEIQPIQSIQAPTNNTGKIIGIISWICYVLSCGLIIFAIIKTIHMIKKKKSIAMIIIFPIIMVVLAVLLAFGGTIASWLAAFAI
jgi:hypothetical protein